jgi:LytS/YehU family sensor histidine kinase
MEATQNLPAERTSYQLLYFLISVITGIASYFAIASYIKLLIPDDKNGLALAATLLFYMGVKFAGQYFTQILTAKNNNISYSLLIGLAAFILIIIGWLYVLAQFPLQDKMTTNLLLFGLPFMLLSLTIGIFSELIRKTIYNQLHMAQVLAEQSRSELNLLQSQLSPHFLFNTLNNMYGISISQPGKIPTLLLKLSELLRYSVYEARELLVPLKSEIAYINNYIDFEKIRMGERLILHTAIEEVQDTEKQIAPMLLIVLIENAFKHAKNTPDERVYVEVNLKLVGANLFFSIKNAFNESKGRGNLLNKSSGLGLANVTKRLELLYAKEYDLKMQREAGFYSVMLQLKIKEGEQN